MAKLVVLKKGSAGVSYELKAERTTIGRLDDNAFQIAEPSVSSHHCEVLMKNNEFLVRDLDSTNGTYIGGQKIKEGTLKPGQTMILGEIEVRLETEDTPRLQDTQQTRTSAKGVNLSELKTETHHVPLAETGFAKKDDKPMKYFIIGGVILGILIFGLLIYALFLAVGK